MRVLFVASYNISDTKVASNGIDHFKLKALVSAGCDVSRLSPVSLPSRSSIARGIRKIGRMLSSDAVVAWKKQHLQEVGLAIERHPLHSTADVILCPNHFDVSFYQG